MTEGLYQDSDHQAAFAVSCSNGDKNLPYILDGTLELPDGIPYKMELLDSNPGNSYILTDEELDDGDAAGFNEDMKDDGRGNVDVSSDDSQTTGRIIQSDIYIDCVALIEYSVFKIWFDKSTQATNNLKRLDALDNIRRYFAHVFNTVDLRFKTASQRININISSFVIEDVEPGEWFTNVLSQEADPSMINAEQILLAQENLTRTTPGFPKYDHLVSFTSEDMYWESGGVINRNVIGLAWIGSMCRELRSMSTVEYRNRFTSIVKTTAHEIAHSLSANHDGDGNTCDSGNNFIMSDSPSLYENTNPFKFSNCSTNAMENYVNGRLASSSSYTRSCLLETLPANSVPVVTDEELPGQLNGPDKQCQTYMGSSSYYCRALPENDDKNVCLLMYCNIPGSTSCRSMVAARGTTCGNKKWCEAGRCVYSENAPAVDDLCRWNDQPGFEHFNDTCPERVTSSLCNIDYYRIRCCSTCKRLNCNGLQCLNNGFIDSNTCRCVCQATFTGDRCETRICSNTCLNGGSINPNTCQCTCPATWTGNNCDTRICPNTCLNGGSINPNTCQCTCPATWTGSNCETRICPNTCLNGGSINPNTCQCTCPATWTGKNCETRICPNTCLNGGSINQNTCQCICPTTWTGSNCETRFCHNTCLNGGTINPSTCQCICPAAWTGANCETGICANPLVCYNGGQWSASTCRCNCTSNWFGSVCTQLHRARIEISPRTFNLTAPNRTSSLTISCSVRTITQGLIITLERRNPHRPIADFMPSRTPSINVLSSLGQLGILNSNADSSSAVLNFTVRHPNCSDGGVYYCRTSYDGGLSYKQDVGLAATAKALPQNIQMSAVPNMAVYNVSTTLKLTCSGNIGNQYIQNMSNFWVWEWRRNANAEWSRYPSQNNLTYTGRRFVGNCQYNASSTLTHTVTADDNGRQFRCYPLDLRYHKSITIYTGDRCNGRVCYRGGVLNLTTCQCNCTGYWTGPTCLNFTGQRIDANPSTVVIGGPTPTPQLEVTCSVRVVSQNLLLIMDKFPFYLPTSRNRRPIVDYRLSRDNPVRILDSSLSNRIIPAGFYNESFASLKVTVPNPRCSDTGLYYCRISYDGGFTFKTERPGLVQSQSYPANIKMTASPELQRYTASTTLRLTCSGNIGNQNLQDVSLLWKWQWRSSTGDWSPYPYLNNIAYSGPHYVYNCQNNGSTTLTHTVTSADNNRHFRCYAVSSEYGDSTTIFTEIPDCNGVVCNNGGTVNLQTCQCECTRSWTGAVCDKFIGQRVTFSPAQVNLNGPNKTPVLNITCSVRYVTQDLVLIIEKETISNSVRNEPIAEFKISQTFPVQNLQSSLVNRVSARGFVNETYAALTVALATPECSDLVLYYCRISYDRGLTYKDPATSNRPQVQTFPENIEMTITPDVQQHSLSSTVQLTCSGNIGNSPITNMADFWTWEWRTDSTGWTTYPFSSRITYSSRVRVGSCQFTGSSVLSHSVTASDNRRQFRCSALDQTSGAKTLFTSSCGSARVCQNGGSVRSDCSCRCFGNYVGDSCETCSPSCPAGQKLNQGKCVCVPATVNCEVPDSPACALIAIYNHCALSMQFMLACPNLCKTCDIQAPAQLPKLRGYS